jgi:hypothetical protein
MSSKASTLERVSGKQEFAGYHLSCRVSGQALG